MNKRAYRTFKRFERATIHNDIELSNMLVGKLESELNFKDEEEHIKWLDVLFTFKFWEDFEELTLKIIRRKERL